MKRIRSRLSVALALAATTTAITTAAAPAEECKPIRFARGASSAVVSGVVPPDHKTETPPSACYTLAVGEGQRAQVRLLKGENVGITIPGVADQQDSIDFTTRAGTYRIMLFQVLPRPSPFPFQMRVAVAARDSRSKTGPGDSKAAPQSPPADGPETGPETMPAQADIVWADLTAKPDDTTVVGNIGAVRVTYTGDIGFAQTDGGGTNYWKPFPVQGGPADGPGSTDLIATSWAGRKTITFSQPVTDVYLALISWNGQAATFDRAFTVIAEGCGYWGCGKVSTSNGGKTVTSPGEFHGILKFAGPIKSLTYTDTTNEYWHGIQIGIGGPGGSSAP